MIYPRGNSCKAWDALPSLPFTSDNVFMYEQTKNGTLHEIEERGALEQVERTKGTK
jgi:hypothetical protein